MAQLQTIQALISAALLHISASSCVHLIESISSIVGTEPAKLAYVHAPTILC